MPPVRCVHALDRAGSETPTCRGPSLLADFEAMFPPDLLGGLKQFLFCGNYGDALVARDTLPIVEYLRTTNPQAANQAGHKRVPGRDAVFWKKLAKLATTVTFSIDGLGKPIGCIGAVQAGIASWRR